MTKAWEYEQARYSYEWDVEDAEDPINPNFRGEHVWNRRRGRMELNYPLWKRIAKSLVTVPVVLGFVIMVFAAAYGNLALQIFLTYHDNGWSNVTHTMNQVCYYIKCYFTSVYIQSIFQCEGESLN